MAQRITSPAGAVRLQMRGISKRFGPTVALDNVELAAASGEVLALVGENGAGKSTLMKVLSGAVKADQGQMWLDGKTYKPANPLAARKAGVAMIYQELSLANHLTVEENITLGMEPAVLGIIRGGQERRLTREAIRYFNHPEIRPEVRVSELSPAARQLVEVARALSIGCRVLVFDEPTSSLNRDDVQNLFKLIKRLKQEGYAIIYISHFLEEVQQVADTVMVLRDGMGVGTKAISETSAEEITALMVGHKVEDLYPRTKRERSKEALTLVEVRGHSKPHSASLTLYYGEVVGIAGLVGAGRTELLRLLFGLDELKSGKIKLGIYEGPASPMKRWRQGAGFLSEDRKEEGLALPLSIADNITLSQMKGLGPAGLVLPRKQTAAAEKWIDKLDIRCRRAGQKVVDLSGGNQQKVALARLLYHDVDVLLLDEPTRGIDVAAKVVIYQLINELACGTPSEGIKPKAVLMVSSYLPELIGICDRIAVMCRGELGPARTVGELNEHKLMLEATGQQVN